MNELFQCPICGLHYRDQPTAVECEKFCRANNACSLELTHLSVEYLERETGSTHQSDNGADLA